MPYNNYFPVGYQSMQYYPQQYQQPQQVQQGQAMTAPNNGTINSGIIWVQGEAGAKSYLVAPNTTVQLWDSEQQTIYLKSADGSGMPSIKVLDYTIRENAQNSVPLAQNGDSTRFATKDELQVIRDEIEVLRGNLGEISKRPAGRPKKAEGVENE